MESLELIFLCGVGCPSFTPVEKCDKTQALIVTLIFVVLVSWSFFKTFFVSLERFVTALPILVLSSDSSDSLSVTVPR